MKIAICSDVHFCQYSSILRSRGEKYSKRLENCIESVNWFEKLARKTECDAIVYLGDFLDQPNLNAEEISAISEIKWSKNIDHYCIVGNHEANTASLDYNSTNILKKYGFEIITKPTTIINENDNIEFMFLPYCNVQEKLKIEPKNEYRRIIFSHNDIKGVQYGSFLSKEGYDINEIEANCDLFLNGHIHNGSWVSKKVRNLGILTGKRFDEDASRYNHTVTILDTDTLQMEDFENIDAYNFYTFDIECAKDLKKLKGLKNNAVVSIRCEESLKNDIVAIISKSKKIVDHRIATHRKVVDVSNEKIKELNAKNYKQKFKDYMITNLGNSPIVIEELNLLCGEE